MSGTLLWAILGIISILAVWLTPDAARALMHGAASSLRATTEKLRNRDIEVVYRDDHGRRGRRRIRMLRLGVYGSWNLYLIAYCYALHGPRRYHFDRIEGVVGADGVLISARDYFTEMRAFGWPPALRSEEAARPAADPWISEKPAAIIPFPIPAERAPSAPAPQKKPVSAKKAAR
jgi:hypothetical protein